MNRLVLASGSPRRRALLELCGWAFEVIEPDVDERPLPGEAGAAYVQRIAAEKAWAVHRRLTDQPPDPATIIAADTSVVLGDRLFGKPAHADDAVQMLQALRGATHQVHTAVAVVDAGGTITVRSVATAVTFKAVDTATINWYVGTGEPLGKAGAYAVQGLGSTLVARIEGSLTNVIGLPIEVVLELLGPPPAMHH